MIILSAVCRLRNTAQQLRAVPLGTVALSPCKMHGHGHPGIVQPALRPRSLSGAWSMAWSGPAVLHGHGHSARVARAAGARVSPRVARRSQTTTRAFSETDSNVLWYR